MPQQLGRAEGKSPRRAEMPMETLEFNRGILLHHDQAHRVLFILEEQILGVPTGDAAAQRARLFDREQRRVRYRGMHDAERVEEREQVVRSGGHGSEMGTRREERFGVGLELYADAANMGELALTLIFVLCFLDSSRKRGKIPVTLCGTGCCKAARLLA
jgi:hypothetical protein